MRNSLYDPEIKNKQKGQRMMGAQLLPLLWGLLYYLIILPILLDMNYH